MPWLKTLHVAAIICWCGLLLYLPALIAQAGGRSGAAGSTGAEGSSALALQLSHRLFTLVATPAALLAIGSGAAIILAQQPIGIWLILKLTVVTAMVGCHAVAGLLIVRLEQQPDRRVNVHCVVLAVVSTCLILAAAWLVLRKMP